MVGVDSDAHEIPGPAGEARIAVGERPGVSTVVRAIKARLLARINQGIDALAVRGNGNADASPIAVRQPVAGELRPCRTTVAGAIESAARTLQRSVCAPRRTMSVPCSREKCVG